VVLHPGALIQEAEVLATKRVLDPLARLMVARSALVTTPVHQAANRIRELARGRTKHGSCGVGFGETVAEALAAPESSLRAGALADRGLLRRVLRLGQERMRAELAEEVRGIGPADRLELRALEDPGVADAWCSEVAWLVQRLTLVDEKTERSLVRTTGPVVFEGAQGVLLDPDAGFHPHTTWSRCTPANARALLADAELDEPPTVWGVVRAHAVRHGPGPFPTEDPAIGAAVREHNVENRWQGPVRHGWFDPVLIRHAMRLSGRIDMLALTHLDATARLGAWGYRKPGAGTEPLLAQAPEIVRQAADPSRVIADIECLLETTVGLHTFGPSYLEGKWAGTPG
jgi:adenylosuccinate synthase